MKIPEFKSESSNRPESGLLAEKVKLNRLLTEITKLDFYARLDVSRNATNEEIDKAFRRKAKEFHPDNKPTELRDVYDRISRLYSEAHATLVNEKEKQRYNKKLGYLKPQTDAQDQTDGKVNQESPAQRKERLLSHIKKAMEMEERLPDFIHTIQVVLTGEKVITIDDIKKIPDIKNWVIKNIKIEIERKSGKILDIRRIIDKLLSIGIIQKEDIRNLSEVKNFAMKDIENASSLGVELFEKTRDYWVKIGVVTKEEINSSKSIKAIVLRIIEKDMHKVGNRYEVTKAEWVEAGVISQIEAGKIKRDILAKIKDHLRRAGLYEN